MASVQVERVYPCTMEQLYSVITSYGEYAEFLSDVKKCTVVESQGPRHLVEYEVFLFKTFKYRLWAEDNGADQISWDLESGDLFKVSKGSWQLSSQGEEQTHVIYEIEVKLKGFTPGPIMKKIMNVNVPNTLDAFEKRVIQKFH